MIPISAGQSLEFSEIETFPGMWQRSRGAVHVKALRPRSGGLRPGLDTNLVRLGLSFQLFRGMSSILNSYW